MAEPQVIDVPDELRYELRIDGERVGLAQYLRRGGRRIFVHTEVDPDRSGEGLGSTLARGALDQARQAGEPILPLCPFIERYVHEHDEYADLVDAGAMACLEAPRAGA